MLKATGQVSQTIRTISGAVFITFMIEGECEPAEEAIKAGQQHNEEVQKAGKGHGLGPPHVYQAQEFMDSLANKIGGHIEGKPAKVQSRLSEFIAAAKIMQASTNGTV